MTETGTPYRRRSLAALALGATLVVSSACNLDMPSPQPASATRSAPAAPARTAPPPPPKPLGTSAPVGFNETEFRDDMNTAVGVVNAFWQRHWTKLFTGSYTAPHVLGLYNGRNPATAPKCAGKPLSRDNAEYCPAGDFVAWDSHLMRTGYAHGDAWVYMVIAHEWGHAIQNRLTRALVSPAAELQADCLAGAALYGAAADGNLRFEAGDRQELVAGFRVIGDRSPWTKPGDHGSATQRLHAFGQGRDGGAPACFRR